MCVAAEQNNYTSYWRNCYISFWFVSIMHSSSITSARGVMFSLCLFICLFVC